MEPITWRIRLHRTRLKQSSTCEMKLPVLLDWQLGNIRAVCWFRMQYCANDGFHNTTNGPRLLWLQLHSTPALWEQNHSTIPSASLCTQSVFVCVRVGTTQQQVSGILWHYISVNTVCTQKPFKSRCDFGQYAATACVFFFHNFFFF